MKDTYHQQCVRRWTRLVRSLVSAHAESCNLITQESVWGFIFWCLSGANARPMLLFERNTWIGSTNMRPWNMQLHVLTMSTSYGTFTAIWTNSLMTLPVGYQSPLFLFLYFRFKLVESMLDTSCLTLESLLQAASTSQWRSSCQGHQRKWQSILHAAKVWFSTCSTDSYCRGNLHKVVQTVQLHSLKRLEGAVACRSERYQWWNGVLQARIQSTAASSRISHRRLSCTNTATVGKLF